MTTAPASGIFQVGDVLNNTYRIEEVLGRGGTSEVYKARSEISGRVVALKALRLEFSRNDDFLALMMREEDMRDIRHEAIVRYYDNQRTNDGLVYLVMDYVEGPGLDKKIAEGGMPADDLMIVARRVTEGLIAAHAKKIVHRDLSPDNIILRNGDPSDAVIIDFGIAKDTNEGAHTIVGNEFAGKYGYAAPEQLSGQTDARADIYALGALLLATFRGKKPDIGANPMEVVERKTRPLDTEGVPEPLRTLIDRMTDPDKNARLQTARAVLDLIDGKPESAAGTTADEDAADLLDATVIAPRPSRADTTGDKLPPKATPPAKKSRDKTPAPKEKSGGGGGRMALIAVVLVAALGVGGFFAGLFDDLLGPSYPVADPYSFVAERSPESGPDVVGHVPSEAVQAEISALMDELGGTANLTLASGDLPDSWGADMAQLIGIVSVLPDWRLVADGGTVEITAETGDATQRAQLTALFQNEGLPGGLKGSANIVYKPPILTSAEMNAILDEHANCGPLELMTPPAAGYGPEDQVMVLGKVADIASRVSLSDTLAARIAGRDLLLNVDVLSPQLCEVDVVLPKVPVGGFDVTFRMGADGSDNVSGQYFVGENPVIDLTIPAHITTGYLFVSAIDPSGSVFHLLPNRLFAENAVELLRAGREGPVDIRLAHPQSDALDGSKVAFVIDDTALGKTKIVVLHADEQIFGGLRPIIESVGGFAQALEDYVGVVRSLDSRILTTSMP